MSESAIMYGDILGFSERRELGREQTDLHRPETIADRGGGPYRLRLNP